MGSARQLHRGATRVLSLAMLVIGVALIAQTSTAHGALSIPRIILGVLFLAAGAGRLVLEARRAAAEGPA